MIAFTDLLQNMRCNADLCQAHISADWQQGRTTFGGMTAALCVAAAERLIPDLPPLRSAQFTFIGPAGGDVEIRPRLLRRGKSSVFVSVDLHSEQGLGTHAVLSFGAARESLYRYQSLPLPVVPAPGTTAAFFRSGKPTFTQHFEAFVAGGHRLVSSAATPELMLWLRHRDPKAMTTLPGVIALGDTLPAAVYTMLSAAVPVSSVTWSIELIEPQAAMRSPADGWYLLRSAGEDVREGYSVQNMSLWSQDGTLITLARQTVAVFG
jgi:acyl-CoA thioesterase